MSIVIAWCATAPRAAEIRHFQTSCSRDDIGHGRSYRHRHHESAVESTRNALPARQDLRWRLRIEVPAADTMRRSPRYACIRSRCTAVSNVRQRCCQRNNRPITRRRSPCSPAAATGFSRRLITSRASRTIGRLSLASLRSTSTAPGSTVRLRQRCWWSGIQPLDRMHAGLARRCACA